MNFAQYGTYKEKHFLPSSAPRVRADSDVYGASTLEQAANLYIEEFAPSAHNFILIWIIWRSAKGEKMEYYHAVPELLH